MSINCKPNATNWKSNNKKTPQVSCAPLPLLQLQFSDSDGLKIGIEKIDSGLRDCSSIGKIKLIQFHRPFITLRGASYRLAYFTFLSIEKNSMKSRGDSWFSLWRLSCLIRSGTLRFHYCVHHVGIVALDSAVSDGDLEKKREWKLFSSRGCLWVLSGKNLLGKPQPDEFLINVN